MKWHIQFSCYALVGIASNTAGYLLYLLLTYAGVGHKMAMTLLYFVGMFQTFIFNKRWTFSHRGGFHTSLARYIVTYVSFYLLNLGVLHLFVDRFSFSHAFVQGAFMATIVGPLFLLQKYWIFPQSNAPSPNLGKAV